jgi:hypothetical protein
MTSSAFPLFDPFRLLHVHSDDLLEAAQARADYEKAKL